MTASIVICQFNTKPHELDDECQRVQGVPQWMVVEGRFDCEHASYSFRGMPGVLVCRCLICVRCGQHTGNNTQGHYWAYCKVTKTTRDFHQCCPGNCELDAV